jgi:trk system potassium uptake protein TrkH
MNMNRTAGFSTVDTASMGLLAHLVLLFLMFVGGAPGSVAGGIKLIVFSVLFLSVWATLRGKDEVTAFGRTIGVDIIKKSIAVTILLLAGILITTGFLVMSEHAVRPDVVGDDFFMPLLFECVSAYATCGLSLGVTDDLSNWGRVAITIAMFIGRVGVLAVLASLVAVTVRTPQRARYPHEPVTVY